MVFTDFSSTSARKPDPAWCCCVVAQGTVTAAVTLGWFEWLPQQLTGALPVRPDTVPELSSYLASLCDFHPRFGMLDGNSSKLGKQAHGDPENRTQSKSSASGKNNLPEKETWSH